MDPKNNKAADKALKQAQKKNAIGSGKSRRYQIGLISALTIIMVVIAVIAVNFLIDYLSDRYMLQLDMTNSDLYEITDETAQMLRTLDEPITCTESAVMLNSVLSVTDVASYDTDEGTPVWAGQAVANLNACRILPESYVPNASLTRAQAARMLSAALDVLVAR